MEERRLDAAGRLGMARKLKVYQTSQGFFDLVIATPSMKAALEAWGANSNLFHQGFASEVDDPKTVKAALAKPGILLKRPVGTSEPFQEEAHLPTSAQLAGSAARATKKPPRKSGKAPSPPPNDKAARKAALAYEKEHQRQQRQRDKEAAAEAKQRERRQKAIDDAEAKLDAAKRDYEAAMEAINDEHAHLDERARREEERWKKKIEPLKDALRKATR